MSGLFGKAIDKIRDAILIPDYDDYEDGYGDHTNEQYSKSSSRNTESRSGETPRLSSGRGKIVDFHSQQEKISMEVKKTYPKDINDAATVCDHLREGIVCLVDLSGMDRTLAQRIADFLGGGVYMSGGTIERLNADIFVVAPSNVRITGEMKEELSPGGHLFPWASSRR